MPIDMGRLNVNAAGTRETFASDLDASASIRASSRISAIAFKAPKANVGNVFVGMATVSSTYGWTLTPGDSIKLSDVGETFDNFYGDAANAGDDIEWVASFHQAGSAA